jgi:hypothetical protein
VSKSRNPRIRHISNRSSLSQRISACCIELSIAAGPVEQERAMWLEVILLALRDLDWGGCKQTRSRNVLLKLNATQSARLFLCRNSPDFCVVCSFVGLDPDYAHSIIRSSGVLEKYDQLLKRPNNDE